MAQTNDENFKKVLSKQTYEQWHKAQWEINLVPFVNRIVAEIVIKEFETNARLAERAKCIAQLKDHQAHCDNCAKDNIEMAIIILEKNEAIE